MNYRPLELKTQNFYQIIRCKYNVSRWSLDGLRLVLLKRTDGHRTYFNKSNLKLNLNLPQIQYNDVVNAIAGKFNQIKGLKLSIINFNGETKKVSAFGFKQIASVLKQNSTFTVVPVQNFNTIYKRQIYKGQIYKGQILFRKKISTQLYPFYNNSFYPCTYRIEHSPVRPINERVQALASFSLALIENFNAASKGQILLKGKLSTPLCMFNNNSFYPLDYRIDHSVQQISDLVRTLVSSGLDERYRLKVTRRNFQVGQAGMETIVNNYSAEKWLKSRFLIMTGAHVNSLLPQNRVEPASNKLVYLTPAKTELSRTDSTAFSPVNKTIGETKVIEAVLPLSKQQMRSNSEIDINGLADQVYQLIERKIRIEKERRGM